MNNPTCSVDTTALERPSPSLLTNYVLTGLLSGPACVLVRAEATSSPVGLLCESQQNLQMLSEIRQLIAELAKR